MPFCSFCGKYNDLSVMHKTCHEIAMADLHKKWSERGGNEGRAIDEPIHFRTIPPLVNIDSMHRQIVSSKHRKDIKPLNTIESDPDAFKRSEGD